MGDRRTGFYLTMMTRRKAEAHVRMVHNVPPGVTLGWTPTRGWIGRATSATYAFEDTVTLRRFMKRYGYTVGRRVGRSRGLRVFEVLECR